VKWLFLACVLSGCMFETEPSDGLANGKPCKPRIVDSVTVSIVAADSQPDIKPPQFCQEDK
jgi:hypothetical protein